MLDILYSATYMNAEDTLLAREEKPKKRHGRTGEDNKDWRQAGG